MPSELIEKTPTEIKELPAYEKPLLSPQRCSFVETITAALKGMCRSKYKGDPTECSIGWESPIDALARKYPYIYTDALF